jgi:hypothetical protein
MNEYKKFNNQQGTYLDNYFKTNQQFYKSIAKQMQLLKQDSIGIDVGAGPGIGAMLADSIGLKTTIYGYEPSNTHFDGINLQKELQKKNSSVIYHPSQLGITGIKTPKENSLNYMLFLRSVHEINLDLKKENKIFQEINRLSYGLKQGGTVVIADPYYDYIPDRKTVELVQEYQMSTIKHKHEPHDYIHCIDLQLKLEDVVGLKCINQNTVKLDKLGKFLENKNSKIENPMSYHVSVFKKA